MPIYEFECKSCGERFELLTSFSRLSEAKCKKCGSDDVKKLVSTFATKTDNGYSSGGSCSSCASGNCSTCSCH